MSNTCSDPDSVRWLRQMRMAKRVLYISVTRSEKPYGYVLRASDQRARASMRVQAIGGFCVLRDSDLLVARWRQ